MSSPKMKSVLRYALTAALLISCGLYSYAQDFDVTKYEVDVYLNEKGYFEVVEQYDVNFTAYKHGIYRDIRTSYDLFTEDGTTEKRKIELSDFEVPGHKYEVDGKFSRKLSTTTRIKIGDANKTVYGPVEYEIRYRVDNAYLYEQNFTRFYWNLKPTDWYAPFENISIRVHLPEGVNLSREDFAMYSGVTGIVTESTDFNVSVSDGVITATSKEGFVSRWGEAVTILVNLPPGSIAEIKPVSPIWSKYGWIFILGALGAVFYYIFMKYGKDDPAPPATTYFPPENIDPAMAGFLINDRADTNDLIAFIPHWGREGYIDVEEIDKKGWFAKDDVKLTKLKDLPYDRSNYEREIWNGLFTGEDEILVSDLRNKFYTTMSSARTKLRKAAQLYYDPKARKLRTYVGLSLVLIMIITVPVFLYFWGILAAVLGFFACLALIIWNIFMIKKNKVGTNLLSELKGFKQFIRTAENNRLKMLIQEQPNYFEATMAYALSFGVFDQWARKFNDLNVPPPSWYHSTNGHFHSMNNFSKSFSSSMASASSTMVSSPSSSGSGGGSSGGGFGGGGGGSW